MTPSQAEPVSLRQHHVSGAELVADRVDLLRRIARPGLIIAEIGVAFGDFSKAMFEILCPTRFDAFDLFNFHEIERLRDRLGGMEHVEFYRSLFGRDDPVEIFVGDSSAELATRPNRYYDLIYVDGDHSLNGVRRDADVAVKKLKDDGHLIFNDYKMADHLSDNFPYGVVHVVNDLCVNHGWRVTHFALQNQMFCDIAIKRAS